MPTMKKANMVVMPGTASSAPVAPVVPDWASTLR
jgi:hypothetical protein